MQAAKIGSHVLAKALGWDESLSPEDQDHEPYDGPIDLEGEYDFWTADNGLEVHTVQGHQADPSTIKEANKTELTADLEEFYNKCHTKENGQFCSEVMSTAESIRASAPKRIKSAINFYTGMSYRAINGALRGKRTADADTKELIQNLDEAFEDHSTPTKGITVYRGLPVDSKTAERMAPGVEITDKGFMSTTILPEETESFTRGGGTVLVIKTKPNTRAIAGAPGESELILPRGSVIRIKRVTQKRGYREVHAEIVEKEAA